MFIYCKNGQITKLKMVNFHKGCNKVDKSQALGPGTDFNLQQATVLQLEWLEWWVDICCMFLGWVLPGSVYMGGFAQFGLI